MQVAVRVWMDLCLLEASAWKCFAALQIHSLFVGLPCHSWTANVSQSLFALRLAVNVSVLQTPSNRQISVDVCVCLGTPGCLRTKAVYQKPLQHHPLLS